MCIFLCRVPLLKEVKRDMAFMGVGMEKVFVSGNGYRVVTKKGNTWIGSINFGKNYNKALKQASIIAKAVADCTVMLIKVEKGEVKLVSLFESGKKAS